MVRHLILITFLAIVIMGQGCLGDTGTTELFEDDSDTCSGDLHPEHHTHTRKRRHESDDHSNSDHQHIEPSTALPYYNISVNTGDVTEGQSIQVEIKCVDSTPVNSCNFENFLIVARDSSAGSTTNYGMFQAVTGTKTICGGQALTADSVAKKPSLTFTWTPSGGEADIIKFKASVIYNYTTFFLLESSDVHVHSTQLYEDERETCYDLLPEHHTHDNAVARRKRHDDHGDHGGSSHTHIEPSTVPSFYSLSVNDDSVTTEGTMTVTITADNCPSYDTNCMFKNFLVVGRHASGSNSSTNYGTFQANSDTMAICSGHGITAKTVKERKSITVTWMAPNKEVNSTHYFAASVVYNYTIFFTMDTKNDAFSALPSLAMVMLMTIANILRSSLKIW